MILALISLFLLIWSVVGFWFACTDAPYRWAKHLPPSTPGWVRFVVLAVLSGPLWVVLDILWRVWIDRLRSDRD